MGTEPRQLIGGGYYIGTAVCKTCGKTYKLTTLMQKFTYFFCHRDQNGYPCKTFNVRKDDANQGSD